MKTHTFLTRAVRHFYNFKRVFLLNLSCLNSILLNFMPGSTSYLISKLFFSVLWRHSSPYIVLSNMPLLTCVVYMNQAAFKLVSVSKKTLEKEIHSC